MKSWLENGNHWPGIGLNDEGNSPDWFAQKYPPAMMIERPVTPISNLGSSEDFVFLNCCGLPGEKSVWVEPSCDDRLELGEGLPLGGNWKGEGGFGGKEFVIRPMEPLPF